MAQNSSGIFMICTFALNKKIHNLVFYQTLNKGFWIVFLHGSPIDTFTEKVNFNSIGIREWAYQILFLWYKNQEENNKKFPSPVGLEPTASE